MVINERKVFLGFHLFRKPEAEIFYTCLRAGARLLKKLGYEIEYSLVMHDPYIQKARNTLAWDFLKSDAKYFVFLADDLEYSPKDLLKLIETPGDVVCGAYRQKLHHVKFPVVCMGDSMGVPTVREDGCIDAYRVQTGFLRINRDVLEDLIEAYPELSYYGTRKDGKRINEGFDFFPQGVNNHSWVGEDYAFCDLWREIGGKIWIIPDLDLAHWEPNKAYRGNYHEYLKRCPGGINGRIGKLERVQKTRDRPIFSLDPLLDSLNMEDAVMAEIGCYTGESTEIFSKSGKFKEITCIDPWMDNEDYYEMPVGDMDVIEELFDKRIKTLSIPINKVHKTSMEAVKDFPDGHFDFVYIDGNHGYDFIKEDILKWLPKIKPNGVLAGHDYNISYDGVMEAVDETFGKDNIQIFPDSSWLIQILRSDSGITKQADNH